MTTTHTSMTRAVAPLATPIIIFLRFLIFVTFLGNWTQAQGRFAAWPQFGGPARNFHVESAAIAHRWPDGGPRQRWRRPLGEGYSSILVDGGTLVTMYRRGDAEIIIALDAETGATRWEYAYSAPLAHDGYFDVWLNAAGPGPYSTPLIADGTVFAAGVNGQFHALDVRTGAIRWSHDLVAMFDLTDYNAFASSPLAYPQTVILPLGGSRRGVVAFKRDTGALAWRSDPLSLAPGSPVLIDLDGQEELVVWGQQELFGLDPDDGHVLWSHPHKNQLGLNISTPVWGPDNRLFVSSAYDGGSRMIRLSRIDGRTTTGEVWFNNRMRLHFGTALRMGGLIVGSSGDFGPAFMVALDVNTGAEVWRERSFARAQMVDAKGTLVILDEDGEIAIASISDKGLRVHARKAILTDNAWTPPTLAGSTLYARDRKDILALDLSE
jgi:outer membrane protein assembly factor BamB